MKIRNGIAAASRQIYISSADMFGVYDMGPLECGENRLTQLRPAVVRLAHYCGTGASIVRAPHYLRHLHASMSLRTAAQYVQKCSGWCHRANIVRKPYQVHARCYGGGMVQLYFIHIIAHSSSVRTVVGGVIEQLLCVSLYYARCYRWYGAVVLWIWAIKIALRDDGCVFSAERCH